MFSLLDHCLHCTWVGFSWCKYGGLLYFALVCTFPRLLWAMQTCVWTFCVLGAGEVFLSLMRVESVYRKHLHPSLGM